MVRIQLDRNRSIKLMGKQLKFGIIDDGGLKRKQIILEPRTGMKNNEWMIAEGTFAGGAPLFARYCLRDYRFPAYLPKRL